MPIKVQCKHCGASLKLADESLGKSVRCSHCKEEFTARAELDDGVSARKHDDQDDYDDRDKDDDARPRRRPKQASSSSKLFIGLLIGGVALFSCCGGVVIWAVFWIRGEPSDKDWVPFVSPEKKFSVLMPGIPVTKEQPTPGANTNLKVHLVDLNRMAFLITFADVPPQEMPLMPLEKRFDAARDGAMKNLPNSVLESEKAITFEKYPGRQFVLNVPKPNPGRFVTRLVMVDNRIYILTVGGVAITAESKSVAKFFDSFKVLTPPGEPASKQSLAEARQGFTTNNIRPTAPAGPLSEPPKGVFVKTKFDSPVGKLSTYLTPDPKDGKKHPAIIWITGGDCNSVDDSIWKDAPASNDQTASAFRKAGIVMMFPSLRGGNDNPGNREGFFGEVNDVLAAADFLAKQSYVDPKRIYLGGHSTGGTLVLLAAEYSDRFRAVFSFGPVHDVRSYPPEFTPFDTSNQREAEFRSPLNWLHAIKTPVFVIEGAIDGNAAALDAMKSATTNAKVHFYNVAGANHFSILAPTTAIIAAKILTDKGDTCNIAFTNEELTKRFRK